MLDDKDIVNALKQGQPNINSPDDLIYKQIFPYYYVPVSNPEINTTTEAKTFITMQTYIPRIRDKYIEQYTLDIAIIANKDNMKYGGFIVTDYLVTKIVPLIVNNEEIGFDKVNLRSCVPYPPLSPDFSGYILSFDIDVLHKTGICE